ncbi:MAG: ABC transporter permease [Thermomicrobiales bacterium]
MGDDQMLGFALRRLVRGIATLWVVVTLVFFGLRLQGDPVTLLVGFEASPEAYDAMRSKLGLDESPVEQYVTFLSLIVHGDFGDSIRERRPATEVVFDRLAATARLATAALALTLLIGIPLGVLAAKYHNTATDRGLMAIAFLGQSTPDFFSGILLILTFSLWLTVLPSSGSGSLTHLIMPAVTLAFGGIARMSRLTRSSVLEVLNEDYIRTARAKGLSEWTVTVQHVLRNASIPLLTVFGIQMGLAISGAVVVETVFAWPGVGRLVANSVLTRDYPVIQFAVVVIAVSVVLTNFCIDLAYGALDPRIRTGGR